MTDEFKYMHNSEILCPWCNKVNSDSWEIQEDTETDCGHCGKPISIGVYHPPTKYTTRKVEADND